MIERHRIERLAGEFSARTVLVRAAALERLREILAIERRRSPEIGFESDRFGSDGRTAFLDCLSREGDHFQLVMIGEPGDLQGLLVDRDDVGSIVEPLMNEDLSVAVFNLSDSSGFVCDSSDEGGVERVFDVTAWGRLADHVAPTASSFEGAVYRRPRKMD